MEKNVSLKLKCFKLKCDWVLDDMDWSGSFDGNFVRLDDSNLILGYSSHDRKQPPTDILIGMMTSNGMSFCKFDVQKNSEFPVWFDVLEKRKGEKDSFYGTFLKTETNEGVPSGEAKVSISETSKDSNRILEIYDKVKRSVDDSKRQLCIKIINEIASQKPEEVEKMLKDYRDLGYDDEINPIFNQKSFQ